MTSHPTIGVPGTLSCDQLLALTGYTRVGDMRRALDEQRIRYFLGRDGAVWTTIDLVNAAGGLAHGASANDPLPAETFR